MSEIRKSLTRLSPRPEDMDNPRRDPYPDELLVESLGSAAPAVVEFAKVAYAAAEHDHSVACVVLREGLHELQYMTHVNRPVVDDDFIDFLVQEMFVILVAGLVKNERWTTLHTLLNALVVDQKGERAPWSNFCRYIKTLDEWRRQRLNINRTSIAADMYHARHQGEGRLAEIAPLHELEDADIFLTFVTGYLPPEGEPEWGKWLPRITLGTERLPPWLARMSSRKYADTLLPLLWMQPTNPDERRSIFKEKLEQVRTINKRVWRMSFLRSPGDFAEKLAERLYSLP